MIEVYSLCETTTWKRNALFYHVSMFHFQTSEVMIGFERGYYNYLNFIKILNVAKISWFYLDKFWDNRLERTLWFIRMECFEIPERGALFNSFKQIGSASNEWVWPMSKY